MPSSVKLLRFFCASILALAVCAVVPLARADPAGEGSGLFTVLSALRPPVALAPEILVIQTAARDGTKPYRALDLADAILTLGEFEASRVLAVEPLEGPRSSGTLSPERKAGLEARFDREFSLIRKNIATVFEAIRLGSIRTRDTARFVDELLALVDNSRTRLLEETLDGGDSGALLLSQAIAALGAGRFADNPAALGYVLPEVPDSLVVVEYPVVQEPGSGPQARPAFRRLDMAELVRYSSLDRALYAALYDMERSGYMAGSDPGAHAPALYDHALELKRDLLDRPSDAAARAWREAREGYLRAVSAFLSGGAESALVAGYDGLLSTEAVGEAGAARIADLKRGVSASFGAARSAYVEYNALRSRLGGSLRGSICVLGQGAAPDQAPGAAQGGVGRENGGATRMPAAGISAADKAAALVNGVMVGRFVLAPGGLKLRIGLFILAVVISGLLTLAWLPGSLVGAFVAPLATSGLAVIVFVYRGLWLDPGAVFVVVAAATAGSLGVELVSRRRVVAWLRRHTGNRLPDALIAALAAGHTLPSTEDTSVEAAILTVRQAGAAERQTGTGLPFEVDDDAKLVSRRRDFQEAAAAAIKKRGGVILSAEGFMVSAGFGTPLQLLRRGKPEQAARQAFMAAMDLALEGPPDGGPPDGEPPSGGAWLVGIDWGECRFTYAPMHGYGAFGHPVKYAHILSGLATKYGCVVLVTDRALARAGEGWKTRRRDSLVEKASGEEQAFHELSVQTRP